MVAFMFNGLFVVSFGGKPGRNSKISGLFIVD
jgi:hypothetical protein